MLGRVDVIAIHKGVRWACVETSDGRWECGVCRRAVIARRYPGLLWSLHECRVCHSQVTQRIEQGIVGTVQTRPAIRLKG